MSNGLRGSFLTRPFVRLRNAFNQKSVLEAPKLVTTKTLVPKHYYRRLHLHAELEVCHLRIVRIIDSGRAERLGLYEGHAKVVSSTKIVHGINGLYRPSHTRARANTNVIFGVVPKFYFKK